MMKLSSQQRALYTIKKLKHALKEQINHNEPIAIIGLSCRFPQAASKEEFWQLLLKEKNVITHYPEERWKLLSETQEQYLRDINFPYWGGYLTDIEKFDAHFFSITPREAQYIDPQQRLLLTVAYEAFEDAGLVASKLAGSDMGVFIGAYASEFIQLLNANSELDALYLPTGNAASMIANRLSYLFDLHGPSLVVDTACSSSLLAVHLACQAIRTNQCQMALVGGVSINLLPSNNRVLSQAKMLSADGQCKTFDANANGYVPGEGAGVVILKSLAKALEEGDRIYAVIAGSATNQDGKTNGLTAPNGAQQEVLLKKVYKDSKIDPAWVSYIECHGTGTYLGDPIEVEALGNIIGNAHTSDQSCWLGSVKTNIGHLEPVAGIAGLIKVILAMQHKKIPANLNLNKPNPLIPFPHYNFRIPQQLEDWPAYGDYRVAGISGFGFGGTNVHVVIREYINLQANQSVIHEPLNNSWRLFVISAVDPNWGRLPADGAGAHCA